MKRSSPLPPRASASSLSSRSAVAPSGTRTVICSRGRLARASSGWERLIVPRRAAPAGLGRGLAGGGGLAVDAGGADRAGGAGRAGDLVARPLGRPPPAHAFDQRRHGRPGAFAVGYAHFREGREGPHLMRVEQV